MNKQLSEPGVSDNAYEVEYEAGQDSVRVDIDLDMHKYVHKAVHILVFGASALLILLFVTGALLFPAESKLMLEGARGWSINNFDWLFMISANIFVLFCLALIVSPVGKIRLGGAAAKPEFSRMSWLSMLFSAGMGIGLMFWSVAEPVAYYTDWYGTPLNVTANTPEAVSMALGATMFHWGLHPWAIYGVVGLALAFFSYNKGLPLTIRSAFFPLLGNRIWGSAGHVIDILAVLATMFGLATSLGLGAQQAASGLNHLFGIDAGISTQIAVIVVVTAIALFSVMRGLDGGIKLLSNINMSIALVLLLFIVVVGSTSGFFANLVLLLGSYAENIVPLSNWVGRDDETWYHGWTVFYWAWWISWSPFVGMFIARVSKGRTVREFMIAVLLIPTLMSAIWMAAFGGNALDQIQNNIGELTKGVGDVSLTMFHMLANLPLAEITSGLAVILVLVFFITSSDSGSLVVDSITAGGKIDGPAPQRVFWAVVQGLIAGVLLIGGGADSLKALQAGSITAGLPFTVILLLMCISLYKGLRAEIR